MQAILEKKNHMNLFINSSFLYMKQVLFFYYIIVQLVCCWLCLHFQIMWSCSLLAALCHLSFRGSRLIISMCGHSIHRYAQGSSHLSIRGNHFERSCLPLERHSPTWIFVQSWCTDIMFQLSMLNLKDVKWLKCHLYKVQPLLSITVLLFYTQNKIQLPHFPTLQKAKS